MRKIFSLLIVLCLLSATAFASDTLLFGENISEFKNFPANGSSVSIACTDNGVYTTGGIGAVKMLGFKPDGTAVSAFEPMNGVSSAFKVVSGTNHVLAVTTSGKLYAWGDNTYGQLGTGNTEASDVPVHISSITGTIIDIAAGDNCSFAITYDGSVYAWGDNTYGQLGDGTTESKLSPTKISTPMKVALIASGNNHTFMLSTIGKTYVCGKNDCGQLGTGNTDNVLTPTHVPTFDGSIMYALGDDFSAALSSGGSVTVCGKNDLGQLGLGNTDNVSTPTILRSVSGIYYIAAGDNHVVAASSAGGIYSWGDNTYGQLGRDGDTTVPARTSLSSSVTSIDAGKYSSAIVTVAGVVNLCGNIVYSTDEETPIEEVPTGDIPAEENPAETITVPADPIPDNNNDENIAIIGGADGPTSIIVAEKPDAVSDIGLLIDGNWIVTDVPPMIIDDRTLVPVRGVFEALGINVEWNGETRTVTALSADGNTSVSLGIGSKTAVVNGVETEIDVPAQIVNDRTLVPVRFIVQSLGCKVSWNGELRTVIINSK